jgi:hypothetical protein
VKLALPITLLLMSCAGNQALERSVLLTNTASEALLVLDREIEPLYEFAAETALENLPAGSTLADYNAAMVEWNTIEEGLRTTHTALLAMQSALRAWEDGSQTAEGDYRSALACAVQGLKALADAAAELNVPVPPEVEQFTTLGAIAAGECRSGP